MKELTEHIDIRAEMNSDDFSIWIFFNDNKEYYFLGICLIMTNMLVKTGHMGTLCIFEEYQFEIFNAT